jgi:hypothetical protein
MEPSGSANALSYAEFQRAFTDWYVPLRNFIYYRCGDMELAEDLAQDSKLEPIWVFGEESFNDWRNTLNKFHESGV